mgnify:CR=1 FL=1
MRDYDLINQEFRKLVSSNLDMPYCVFVSVFKNEQILKELKQKKEKTEEDIRQLFKENKDKLEKFVIENQIYVYNPFQFLPAISLKMTGKQILELSKEEYVEYISRGDQPIFRAV